MTDFDQLVLSRVITKTQAWEALHDREYSNRLNMVDLRHLMVVAGYSKESADAAAKQRGWDRLVAGVEM